MPSDYLPGLREPAAINNDGCIATTALSSAFPQWRESVVLLTPHRTESTDINADCRTDVDDLLLVIFAWGQTDSPADVNRDKLVDVGDLLDVISAWAPAD